MNPKLVKGDKWEHLTIIDVYYVKRGIRQNNNTFVDIICDCGKKKYKIEGASLLRGNTKSCGCLAIRKFVERVTTHNLTNHPLFDIWRHMIRRCTKTKAANYYLYGGRGIRVCDNWLDIKNFINDMYPSYMKGLKLERINNNEGYSLSNCKWATPKEQSNNRRNTIFLTYQGETLGMSEWARKLNVSRYLLEGRLMLGWTHEDILSIPSRHKNKREVQL